MLIGLNNVTFEFGARTIVRDATWHIQPNERIGLIGYNGTGKSTLLKVLVQEYSPSVGTVEKGKETTIGYLHQDLLSFDSNESILDVAMSAFEKVIALQKEQAEIEKTLETIENEDLLVRYTDILHEIEVHDGYTIEHRTEEVLHGLGFTDEQILKPYKQFSGGWRMRVLLAKMILQNPDVLLLDEPTNHLDLPSIEWLEKYLVHYQGSVVIVSHDKFFLDKMVTKIVEVYQQELHIYSGNYSYFEAEKLLRIDMQQKAYENQQDYIRQQEKFVDRFKAKASKAALAQSVVKRLDKLERIESVELERPNIRINFNVNQQPGKIIATLKNASKSFGDNVILKNSNLEVDRGDKIALIGANGKGKSTLLRMIVGNEPFEGERVWGHNVVESFYAQHQLEALDVNNTLIEEMMGSGAGKSEQEYRNLLGGFLFGGDDVDKKIKVLSGGEKARVALAKVIVSKGNVLLLDEPTNHLDIHSVQLLAESLDKYEGSIILVSHDRYFISKTANKIWEIVDNEVKEFKGSYAEWMDWNERMALKAKEAAGGGQKFENSRQQKGEGGKRPEYQKPQPAATNKWQNDSNKNELSKVKKQFEKLESELSALTEKKKTLEAKLGDSNIYSDKNKYQAAEKDYQAANAQHTKMQNEYEKVFEQMMGLEA